MPSSVRWGDKQIFKHTALTAAFESQDVLGNPMSIDDSAETLSKVLDAKAVVVKGEKPQLQVCLTEVPVSLTCQDCSVLCPRSTIDMSC